MIRWDGKGNNYFFCFPLPTTNEHLFNLTRFIPLIFTWSFCNYQTDSWRDLFSLDIWILFAFLRMQLNRSYWLCHFKVTLWAFEFISNFYPSITKQTPQQTEIYNNNNWKRNNKKQFPSVEIGNDILVYINIKHDFQIDID